MTAAQDALLKTAKAVADSRGQDAMGSDGRWLATVNRLHLVALTKAVTEAEAENRKGPEGPP